MASDIRSVGRHTLIYGAGIVLSKLVSFVMLPVYTHYLTPADFGVLELLDNTVDVIGMIAGLGLAAGLFKYYAELETPEEKRRLLSTVLIGNSALTFIVMTLGIALAGPLNQLVFKGHTNPLYFRLFFVSYFFSSFSNLGLAIVRAEERSGLYVGATLAKLVITLSLNIWLVVGMRAGIVGVLIGNSAGAACLAIGLAIHTFRKTGIQFALSVFRRLSKFGAPVGISTLGSFVLTFSDRYYLNNYAGQAAVGVYSLAYSFAFLLGAFAVVPFTQIWEPRRFAIAKQPDAGETYRRMFVYLNIALFGTSVGIMLFIRDVLSILVAPAFVPAYQIVPLLLVVTIIQQWTWYTNFGLFLKNSTGVLAWSGIVAAVSALLLNWLLIPRYGMFGAAWATVIAYVIRFVPTYVFAQAKYHVSYAWGKNAVMASMLVAVLVIRHFADGWSVPISIAFSIVCLPFFAAWVYAGLLDATERQFVRAMIRKPLAYLPGRSTEAVS